MMKIKRRKISACITAELMQVFQKNLLKKFNPLIAGMKKEYWNRVSLPAKAMDKWLMSDLVKDPVDSEKLITGDLIMSDADTLLYYKYDGETNCLEVGIITRDDIQKLSPFCEQIEELMLESKIKLESDWEEIRFSEDIFRTISETSELIEPTDQEIQASRFLEEEVARKFLEKIKETDATSMNKLIESKETPKIGSIVDKLEKMGLLIKDFIVLCSKTGQPILKVSSKSALDETPQGANKCFICGNPLSKETIDEIVSCSYFGRKLIETNYWMPVRMMDTLESYGISREDVFVWKTENDIINLFLIINEESYLFVLCNRKLTLDDAYYINAYISAYSINHALIISTEKISTIMKRHIKDANKNTEISYIDTLTNCDSKVAYFLMQREKNYLLRILGPYNPLTQVKIQDLVMSKVQKDDEDYEDECEVAEDGTLEVTESDEDEYEDEEDEEEEVHPVKQQTPPPPPPQKTSPVKEHTASTPVKESLSKLPVTETAAHSDKKGIELKLDEQKPRPIQKPPVLQLGRESILGKRESSSHEHHHHQKKEDDQFLMEEVFPVDEAMEP